MTDRRSGTGERLLSKCANPECTNRFLYLRGGRLVPVKIEAPAGVPGAPRQELYWLCPACADTVRLTVDDGQLTARRVASPAGSNSAA